MLTTKNCGCAIGIHKKWFRTKDLLKIKAAKGKIRGRGRTITVKRGIVLIKTIVAYYPTKHGEQTQPQQTNQNGGRQ